jgi:hypothetical protein
MNGVSTTMYSNHPAASDAAMHAPIVTASSAP